MITKPSVERLRKTVAMLKDCTSSNECWLAYQAILTGLAVESSHEAFEEEQKVLLKCLELQSKGVSLPVCGARESACLWRARAFLASQRSRCRHGVASRRRACKELRIVGPFSCEQHSAPRTIALRTPMWMPCGIVTRGRKRAQHSESRMKVR